MIRCVESKDAARITEIYNEYVRHTTVTFELDAVSLQEMEQRIRQISSRYPYLVYEKDGCVVGYCYVHGWKERKAYEHTVETTVYLDPLYIRQGAGTLLMKSLIEKCRMAGFHALVACITEENDGSIALHEKLGFKKVSHFKEVGYKFGKWLGIVDYELLI